MVTCTVQGCGGEGAGPALSLLLEPPSAVPSPAPLQEMSHLHLPGPSLAPASTPALTLHPRCTEEAASLQQVPEQTVLSKTDGGPPFTHNIPRPPQAAYAFISLLCNAAYRACVATLRLLPLAYISISP